MLRSKVERIGHPEALAVRGMPQAGIMLLATCTARPCGVGKVTLGRAMPFC